MIFEKSSLENEFWKMNFDELHFWSISNLIFTACVACKIQVFQLVTWIFSRWRPKKNPGLQDLKFFLKFEADINFSRP
jgi:hypothetical protein